MCTAITFQTKDHYFGRNLDLEFHYRESVTIMPRNYTFQMRYMPALDKHFAMIGTATIDSDYPLYYDATNEYGLSMAALNFPGNAVYLPVSDRKQNVAPFELIPWLLCQCKTVDGALKKLDSINLANISYSEAFPLTPLHWLLADKERSVTIEPTVNGLEITDNPVGVLTNNPPFAYHMFNLSNYMHISNQVPQNHICPGISLKPYSNGMGGIGLPGDLSSASRFIRAVFIKWNSVCADDDDSSINQFFHILNSVEQQSGCVQVGNKYEKTVYSSCCNTDTGVYYYTTYENRQITGVSMHSSDLNLSALTAFPLRTSQQIKMENENEL